MITTARRGRRRAQSTYRHPPKTPNVSWLKRNWRPFYILVTIAIDSVAIVLAGAAAYTIRSMIVNIPIMSPGSAALLILASCAVTIMIGLVSGVYRSACRIPLSDQSRDAARAYLYSMAVIVCGMFLVLGAGIAPRFAVLFLALIPLFFVMGRVMLGAATRYMRKQGYGRQNALIVNWSGTGPQLFDRFTMFPELGYAVRGFICSSSYGTHCTPGSCTLQRHFRKAHSHRLLQAVKNLPCYGLDQIEQAIETEGIQRMFVPMVKPSTAGFAKVMKACHENQVTLKVISSESEELLRFARIKDIAGIPLHAPPRIAISRLKARLKRGFDLALSLVILAILSPLLAVVALAILVEDGRPVFFRQKRGLSQVGTYFDFMKFRSMVKNAEAKQHELNRINETEGGLFLMKNDPRVTRVGKWLRKFSIDELPQLINVVRGEMSLVGPRPLPMSDLKNIETKSAYADYYHIREKVRPGMTGLWQILGRRDVPFREMVLLDLYYYENQSIMFDLEILFATIPVVLFGRGAY